jgi:hypothetical protein
VTAAVDVAALALAARGFAYWRAQPTIEQGHTDNLVHDADGLRVWVSRMTLADYDGDLIALRRDRLTIERHEHGRWIRVEVSRDGR